MDKYEYKVLEEDIRNPEKCRKNGGTYLETFPSPAIMARIRSLIFSGETP